MPSKVPLRKCIVCSKRDTKERFLMLVRPPKGIIETDIEVFDGTHKKSGRGYYICKDTECIKKAKKSHRLERIFGKRVVDDVESLYDKLDTAVAECE